MCYQSIKYFIVDECFDNIYPSQQEQHLKYALKKLNLNNDHSHTVFYFKEDIEDD
jgi:hypothetical protein